MKTFYRWAALALSLCLPVASALGQTYRPVQDGPWRVLFAPQKSGDYLNDHTVFQDAQGVWRVVGITSPGKTLLGADERYFAHAQGASLDQPMAELEPLFRDGPDRRRKWAPHVIEHDGVYHLFAGPGPVRHFRSEDGVNWSYVGLAVPDPWWNLRDTMVLQIAPDRWLMYATDRDDTIAVFESSDLESWRRAGTAFRAIRPAPIWGWIKISATESPFVMKVGDDYYLAVCLTNAKKSTYLNTVVFRSKDPYNFGVYAAGGPGETAAFVTRLEAHCAEFIRDAEGRWYFTTAGWIGFPDPTGVPDGVLAIAPLKWEPLP